MVTGADTGLLTVEPAALVEFVLPDGFGGAAGSEGALALLGAGPEGATLGGGAGAF